MNNFRGPARAGLGNLGGVTAKATLVFLALSSLAGCETDAPTPRKEPPPAPAAQVELVEAEATTDAVSVIAREAARAQKDGRKLIVYVGAPWCEPCVRFHKAAAAGELDAKFPDLRLLEFDHDRHEAALTAAGCVSRLIPLFARPSPDGRCSEQRMEGSIKGEGAVAEISPRLAELLR